MKGACAVVIDENKAFFSFCRLKKPSFKFLEAQTLVLPQKSDSFFNSIKDNAEIINQALGDIEKRYCLKIDKVFFEVPEGLTNTRIVTDIVPLRGKKRISAFDINFVKKHLEDKFLDWDDYGIHNITFNYSLRGTDYLDPPFGVWAKKLEVKSLLVSIKDKIYKEIEDTFDNFGRGFIGFVSSMISTYASVFKKRDIPQVVMRCDYQKSNSVIRKHNDFIILGNTDFSLKHLIEKLARRFFLDFSLTEELFERYISFKEIPYFKEITIKKEGGYINLSTQTMNLFIKDYIRSEITNILEPIKQQIGGDDFIFSFLGKLTEKEGFYRFLRNCVPCRLATPLENSASSSSFGCLRYGLLPFLELDYKKRRSLLQRIRDVYKEYF